MRDSHFDGADLRIRPQRRRAIAPSGAQKGGKNTTLLSSMTLSGRGTIFGGRGRHDREGIRSLRQEGFGSQPTGGQVVIMDDLEAPTGPGA